DRGVERSRRREIAPKRLLDHDPPPAVAVLIGETSRAELPHDVAVEARRGRQVVELVVGRATLGVDLLEPLAQPRVGGRVAEIAGEIKQARREAIPRLRIIIAAQLIAEALVVPL